MTSLSARRTPSVSELQAALLAARRLANEAQLSARLMQLDALELRYRLLLDAHQLWAMD